MHAKKIKHTMYIFLKKQDMIFEFLRKLGYM
jgi:hypothetical protein